MVDLPRYDAKLNVPSSFGAVVQPASVPTFESGAAVGAAAVKMGDALGELSARLRVARSQTEYNLQTSAYLTAQDELERRFTENADYKTAPQDFERERGELARNLLSEISDPVARSRAQLEWQRSGLSAAKRVRATAFGQEAGLNIAAVDEQEAFNVRSAVSAASLAEKQAAIDAQISANTGLAAAGYITPVDLVKRNKRLSTTLETAEAMEIMRNDPARAGKLLDDPNAFVNIAPLQREQLRGQAKAQSDAQSQLRVTASAAYNPAGAIATTGFVANPSHAKLIFDAGVVPIESGNNPGAVSKAGALGVSQLMPDTARMVARQLGMRDVVDLSDDALKARLLDAKDPLNYRLGSAHWGDLLRRYGGNVWAAAAAYNAGPGNDQKPRADAWHARAVAEFGPGYTAAQLQSLIPISETRDYVGKLAKQLGADPAGGGMSAAGRLRAAVAVGEKVNGVESRDAARVKALAQAGIALIDPAGILKDGRAPDPVAEATWVQQQTAAADVGDLSAAKRLRDYDFAKRMAPAVRQAYATSPVELDNLIAGEEARQASAPVNGEDVSRLQLLKEVSNEVRRRAHAEPVALLSRAGVGEFAPIDARADASDPAFLAALRARGVQAVAAQRLYQGSANPFMAEESAALKERYAAAGAGEKFALVRALAETLPERALDDALQAVTGSDHAAVVARIARDRPDLGRAVLRGFALLAGDKQVQEKSTLVRAGLQNKLGTDLWPDPAMREGVIKAALALDAARRDARGSLYDNTDTSGLDQAIEDVAGKIVRRNGVKVAAPPGMSAARFNDVLDNLDTRALDAFGGAYDRNGRPFDAGWLGDHAQLRQLAPGSSRYVVMLPSADGRGAPVMTASEIPAPLVIDLAALSRSAPPPPLTPYQRGRAQIRSGAAERLRDARDQSEIAP